MEIRPLTQSDLPFLADIDATIDSAQYLHIDKTGEGLSIVIKIDPRPLREKSISRNAIDDDLSLSYRQIATGADEGIGLVAEHDGQIVASALAQPDTVRGVMRLLDVRVDFDFRRQGIGMAMAFAIIQTARQSQLRAVFGEMRANNFPASQFLLKAGFDLSGVDTRRDSNHDIVKESATLIWYVALD